MPQGKYIAAELSVRADQERLSYLEQTMDPTTIRHLEALSVGAGWTCLEVGAGYGSITCWLAEKVGATGNVVATDIRPDLHRPASETIELRRHDILNDELEKDHYELVHCRALLQHLREPELAVSRMAEAVKPGGWLLIEEIDNSACPASDGSDPFADTFYKFRQDCQELTRTRGILDPEFGRRLRPLLDGLQFEAVGSEGVNWIVRGGEPLARFTQMAYQTGLHLVSEYTPAEVRIRESLNDIERLLGDPSFYYVSGTLFSAWGRKPAGWVCPTGASAK